MGIILSLIIFSFVVFFHELGHLLVGLKMGAEPKEFSIGFGKAIYSRPYKGVNLKIGSIPFGGYVEFNKDANHPNPELRISHFKGILVYLAGPFFNFLLSWILLFFLVVKVGLNPPHQKYESNLYNEIEDRYPNTSSRIVSTIGVTNTLVFDGVSYFFKSLKKDFKISDILNGSTGPIGITHDINDAYSKNSWLQLYFMIIMLSASLGFSNLIPLGILDGGRVLSSVVKLVFSERSAFVLRFYDRISLILLIGLFFMITVKDLIGVIHP
jgi:membrane-associated protease RseP (regulator of RpoE activity)